MEDFLKERAVTEQQLADIRNDKIDETCVEIMSDEQLKHYLPKYGDRLALRGFVTKMKTKRSSSERKQSLLEQLRVKLQTKTSDKEIVEPVKAPLPKNAEKAVKKVGIGLMRYSFAQQCYSQVRTKNGGGTRTIPMSKSAKKEKLLKESLQLFFPDDFSQRFGSKADFEFDIMDYQGFPLNADLTIQEVSDVTKLPNLRFYLSMKEVVSSDSNNANEPSDHGLKCDENENTSQIDGSTEVGEKNIQSLSKSTESPANEQERTCTNVSSSSTKSKFHDRDITSYNAPTNELDAEQPQGLLSSTSSGEDTNTDINFDFDAFFQNMNNHSEEQHNFNQHTIQLHRGHVFSELKSQFASRYDFVFDIFTFEIILPNGEKEIAEDNGGVVRDALVEFWESFYEQCTLGREYKVPFLRHDFKEDEWKSIARVLFYGWKEQKYFPIRLSKAFMSCCLYGMDTFASSHQLLVNEFLSYILLSESKAVSSALEGDFDAEEIIEILGNHDCRVSPTSENLKQVLGEIAHKEIIQEPMYIKECWFNELNTLGFDIGNETLDSLYDSMIPSNRRVGKLLSFPEVLTSAQTVTANFLKKYVRELEPEVLAKFLRFCTGSDVLLSDGMNNYLNIAVRFTSVTGIARSPVAHTCGRVLEIPEKYDSYLEFRSEFSSVLKSDIWVMDFV